MMEKMMNIAEAANELGCSTSNVRQLIKRHGIETEQRTELQLLMVKKRVTSTYVDVEKLKSIRRVV